MSSMSKSSRRLVGPLKNFQSVPKEDVLIRLKLWGYPLLFKWILIRANAEPCDRKACNAMAVRMT